MAVQSEAETHDTPDSSLSTAPLGFGVASMLHAEPFQSSASVCSPVLVEVSAYPTALQADAEMHDTSSRVL